MEGNVITQQTPAYHNYVFAFFIFETQRLWTTLNIVRYDDSLSGKTSLCQYPRLWCHGDAKSITISQQSLNCLCVPGITHILTSLKVGDIT